MVFLVDVASPRLVLVAGVAEDFYGGNGGDALPFLSLLFSDVDSPFFTMLISFFDVSMHRHGLMCLKIQKRSSGAARQAFFWMWMRWADRQCEKISKIITINHPQMWGHTLDVAMHPRNMMMLLGKGTWHSGAAAG